MPRKRTTAGRRNVLKLIGGSAASLSLLPGSASGASPEETYESAVESIMSEFDIEGVSIATVPTSRWLPIPSYRKAIGINNVSGSGSYRRETDYLEPSHRLRMASVSKLLTSVAILQLIEGGELDADDRVFGRPGILNPSDYGDPDCECPLTISDLLNHNYQMNGSILSSPPTRYTLQRAIEYINSNYDVERFEYTESFGGNVYTFGCADGDDYHNYGYGVLGAVIEETVGNRFAEGAVFEDYVRSEILEPVGSGGMDRTDSAHGAVENEGYHHSDDRDPYADSLVHHRGWSYDTWAGTALEVANFGRSVLNGAQFSVDAVDEFSDLTDFGWQSYNGDAYVGHSGSHYGVRAALRCSPERCFCVLQNTRHKYTWDDRLDDDDRDPLTRILNRTYEFIE